MPDSRTETVIREIIRVLAPGGHVLVVEETDSTLEAGDVDRADLGYTEGPQLVLVRAAIRAART